jgi:hypothetical protein
LTTGWGGVTILSMKTVGRLGLIALILVLLGAPAGAACVALGEWMAGCHDTTAHEMSGCSDETALGPACCGTRMTDSATDLVLKRPGDEDVLLLDATLRTTAEIAAVTAHRQAIPAPGPPARPPRDALFSTLLL